MSVSGGETDAGLPISDRLIATVRAALPAEPIAAMELWRAMRWRVSTASIYLALRALVARGEVEKIADRKPARYRRKERQ